MYILPHNVCTSCWEGTIVNGTCTHCHQKAHSVADRRADALPLRETINSRYWIGDVLGNGGFGLTYSAWDPVECRAVAIKELYPRRDVYRGPDGVSVRAVSGQEQVFAELKKRFEDEAKLLIQLGGQGNLVHVYDLFSCNGTIYYTMEYLEGCDLKSYLKQHGPMPWEVLEPMLREVLHTLGALHKQNLIHRDISPDNLFLTKNNQIHLIDFGSVRTYQGNHCFTVHLKDHFAPWEQYITDGQQGPWTDIYALSVTVYLLLSGRLPPKAADRKAGAQVEPLKSLCPKLPAEAASAIEKGMSMGIGDRFQTAEEFLRALPAAAEISHGVYWLYGRRGIFAGQRRRLEVERQVTFGRRKTNDVVFPDATPGVSRSQCMLFVNRSGELYVRDAGSAYGTFLNQKRLGETWVKASPSSYLCFGNEVFQLNRQELPE